MRGKATAYLILHNIGKRSNFGSLLRAAAFGITTVYVIGEKKLKTFGHKGTLPHLTLIFCDSFEAVRNQLGSSTKVCGIEITETARPISDNPFYGDTAFMLGNEGTGMTEKQLSFCDYFAYIPQYSVATGSLNVAIAGSIVLHHFAVWAGYPEASRSLHKFDVHRAATKYNHYIHASSEEIAEHNRLRELRLARKDLELSDCELGNFFHLNYPG